MALYCLVLLLLSLLLLRIYFKQVFQWKQHRTDQKLKNKQNKLIGFYEMKNHIQQYFGVCVRVNFQNVYSIFMHIRYIRVEYCEVWNRCGVNSFRSGTTMLIIIYIVLSSAQNGVYVCDVWLMRNANHLNKHRHTTGIDWFDPRKTREKKRNSIWFLWN